MSTPKKSTYVQNPKLLSKIYLCREGINYYRKQLSDLSEDTKLEEFQKLIIRVNFKKLTDILNDLEVLLPKTK